MHPQVHEKAQHEVGARRRVPAHEPVAACEFRLQDAHDGLDVWVQQHLVDGVPDAGQQRADEEGRVRCQPGEHELGPELGGQVAGADADELFLAYRVVDAWPVETMLRVIRVEQVQQDGA